MTRYSGIETAKHTAMAMVITDREEFDLALHLRCIVRSLCSSETLGDDFGAGPFLVRLLHGFVRVRHPVSVTAGAWDPSGRAPGEWPPDQSARLDHEPDANGRNLAVIAITVRSRGLKADRVPRREHMLIKTERQLQLATDQVGVLGPVVPHQPAVCGGGAARLVRDEQEVDMVMRHLTQPLPGHSRLQGQQLAVLGANVRPDPLGPIGAEVAQARGAGNRSGGRRLGKLVRVKQVFQRQVQAPS